MGLLGGAGRTILPTPTNNERPSSLEPPWPDWKALKLSPEKTPSFINPNSTSKSAVFMYFIARQPRTAPEPPQQECGSKNPTSRILFPLHSCLIHPNSVSWLTTDLCTLSSKSRAVRGGKETRRG